MKNRALFVSIFGLLLAGLASAQPNISGAPHSTAFHSNGDSGRAIHRIYVMNRDGSDQSRVPNNLRGTLRRTAFCQRQKQGN
jgi:hypothetical protein